MSGSIKYLIYEDDVAQRWHHKADESNIENVLVDDTIADFELIDVDDVPYYLPQNVEPRRAHYLSTTTTATRSAIIPTQAVYAALRTGDSLIALKTWSDGNGETFQLKRLSPEIIKLPTYVDTGLDDGDVT